MMPAAASAIDFSHLDRFTGGDVAITREVLKLFRDQAALLLDQLRASGGGQSYREAAHALKGAARSVGAWEMAKAAEETERVIGADTETRRQAIAALGTALDAAAACALAYENAK
jgi:HPt (histidine-containing phosphotransfer) domain-containing protein